MSATRRAKGVLEGRILLRLIVESLGLLLQLIEAAFSILVDGILCDLALYTAAISACSRTLGTRRIAPRRSAVVGGTRTILNLCLTVCGA
jgi:hypothetical protein